jgi:hypothetical protein
MVIDDLNIYRAWRSGRPFKAYPPLIIDADAILAFAVALQRFKTVAGQRRKVLDRRSRFQTVKLHASGPLNAGKGFDPFPGSEVEGSLISIADDHLEFYQPITLYVKRNSVGHFSCACHPGLFAPDASRLRWSHRTIRVAFELQFDVDRIASG